MKNEKQKVAAVVIQAYQRGREDGFEAVAKAIRTAIEELSDKKSEDYFAAMQDCLYLVSKEEDLDKMKEH